jgi:hypothetical protein
MSKILSETASSISIARAWNDGPSDSDTSRWTPFIHFSSQSVFVYPSSRPSSTLQGRQDVRGISDLVSRLSYAGKPALVQNGRHGSFRHRKDSSFSSMGGQSFSGFSQFGAGMSRQGSNVSLAPSDGTVRQYPPGIPRRGTGLTAATQNTTSASHRALGRLQKRPADGTWATMDPDEVFRRLNVAEVKRVETQLRYVGNHIVEAKV